MTEENVVGVIAFIKQRPSFRKLPEEEKEKSEKK